MKHTVSADFWANYLKICESIVFTENALAPKLGNISVYTVTNPISPSDI